MEKEQYNRTQLLSSLIHIGHGELETFKTSCLPANLADPYLFGHLTTWNLANGKVRDSKVAFPPIALRGKNVTSDLAENAVACMMSLGPRELMKSYRFSCQLSKDGNIISNGNRQLLEHGLKRYIRVREEKESWWDRAVLSNRDAMKHIYRYAHIKPSPRAQSILFDKEYPVDSVFHIIKQMKNMSALEAAGYIRKFKIPMQVAIGSVNRAKDPELLMAIIDTMTGNELINNSNMLKKLGVFESPTLKSAYDDAISRAKDDTRVNILRASVASEVIDDEKVVKKLLAVQEHQSKQLSIDGDWLVLGDRSGSMEYSIELAKKVAGFLSHQVTGNIYLIFFNVSPQLINVTGKTLDEIKQLTRGIIAQGGTSIGCGLSYLTDMKIPVHGIAIISDGGENTDPYFHVAYSKYCKQMMMEPTVYLYHTKGQPNVLAYHSKREGIEITEFDLTSGIDEYSLPNLIKTMRTSKYSLLDEILNTPLLTFNQVFDN